MSLLHPHAGFRVRETATGVAFDVPAPRRPLAVLLLAAWLAGWAVGVVFVVQQFVGGERFDLDRAFLVLWAVVWLLAGLGAVGYLAWLVAGRERIVVAGGTLEIRHGVGPWGVRRRYPVAEVRGLRPFGREIAPVLAAGLDLAGRGASGVRFHHGERVVRFARALEEPAARALVEQLRARAAFPGDAGHPEQPAA